MRPLIETPEEIEQLEAEARSWLGTDWVPDGAVKGGAVACHKLPSEIIRARGFAGPLAPPRGGLKKEGLLKAMVEWLASHPEWFERVPDGKENIRPGDVLVTDEGYGHLALALSRCNAIHCWRLDGVQIQSYLADNCRVVGVWRPLRMD
ncbi:MAG: hypothetical protein SFV32_12780 [Opitutaceae bacterium]|nr:hypothetical protein [Opitutaceae bacterium]